jgi:hypothetical protein
MFLLNRLVRSEVDLEAEKIHTDTDKIDMQFEQDTLGQLSNESV